MCTVCFPNLLEPREHQSICHMCDRLACCSLLKESLRRQKDNSPHTCRGHTTHQEPCSGGVGCVLAHHSTQATGSKRQMPCGLLTCSCIQRTTALFGGSNQESHKTGDSTTPLTLVLKIRFLICKPVSPCAPNTVTCCGWPAHRVCHEAEMPWGSDMYIGCVLQASPAPISCWPSCPCHHCIREHL